MQEIPCIIMKRLLLLVLFSFCIICCLSFSNRTKRALLFTKNSKLFFRLNGKDNVIPWNQVFAHGWTIRVNYDLPETIQRRHEFFKRDIYNELDLFENLYENKLYSHVLKYFCSLFYEIRKTKKCKMLCNIGNIINRSSGSDVEYFKSIAKICNKF